MPRRIIRARRRGTGWRYVEPHDYAFELGARRWIELHDQRIVPGHDVALAWRQREQTVKTLQHLADMEGRRERPAACHVLVEMRDVGGNDDKSAAGLDTDELQPRRMAAHRM